MDLQEKLKERDDNDLDRTRTKDLTTKNKIASGGTEFSNPAALLKGRLEKWKTNNKEKNNLMNMYIRNVKIIEDAFEQIKEATGISSTEEIVTTFIKAEEQNISLFNYVNVLNSEIDMIEEQNKQIEKEIKRHEELSAMSASDKEKIREQLNKKADDMKSQISEKESQIKDIEQQMMDITNFVQNMVTLFNQSHFFLMVASHMEYDSEVQFNENNVTLYLSELEEYISNLITYLA